MEIRSLHSLVIQNQSSQKNSQLGNNAELIGNSNIDKTSDFTDRLKAGIDQVANAQNNAADLAKAYELGKETDLSKVMIAQQISSLGFQMTLNVRNKALSAYKDIMNMPV
jgi:flagellar hook-basal body complex protein FliE